MTSIDLPPVVSVRDLRFRYRRDLPLVLDGTSVDVPRGARCLVVGANGAGKTTLLRVIGGKHMVPTDAVRVLGRAAFDDTSLAADVEYLGGGFPFEVDIRVGDLVAQIPAPLADRRDRLIRLLGVDVEWHMHRVSDGQRRRVQLLLGLVRPRKLLLLDEVTTDLDLLARQDLLDFLREESETSGVTILYATHILDRLEDWATHLCTMRRGQVTAMEPLLDPGPLYPRILAWLREASDIVVRS
ncbi:MAG TPA: ATP-binding cassette domain-containing protein [Kofleriaceae bacterium]|nr:ATP-binding cassette domain-containing protein [Kofleriaceae bacterium]